jgi:hypothetical protein
MSKDITTNEHRLYSLKKLYEIEQCDEAFIQELVKLSRETLSTQSVDLVKFCEKENWDRVYYIAHKMKANIDLLSIEILKNEIRVVEQNARSGNCLEELREKIYFIHCALQKVAMQLESDFRK